MLAPGRVPKVSLALLELLTLQWCEVCTRQGRQERRALMQVGENVEAELAKTVGHRVRHSLARVGVALWMFGEVALQAVRWVGEQVDLYGCVGGPRSRPAGRQRRGELLELAVAE